MIRAQRVIRAVKILCVYHDGYASLFICATPQSEPLCKYGARVLTACQRRFICVRNAPLWGRMLTIRETAHVWEDRAYSRTLYFPLNFAMNLKLL